MFYFNCLLIISICSCVIFNFASSDQNGLEYKHKYKFTRKLNSSNTTPRLPYSRKDRIHFTYPNSRTKVTWVPTYTKRTITRHQKTGITKYSWTGTKSPIHKSNNGKIDRHMMQNRYPSLYMDYDIQKSSAKQNSNYDTGF